MKQPDYGSPGPRYRGYIFLATSLLCLLMFRAYIQVHAATVYSVKATGETAPMPHANDSADDPAIWIHPTNPSLSLIIGTDKHGGIAVYDLAGTQRQYLADGKINNVDLRYNFRLSGQLTDVVTASNQTRGSISVYRVNPTARQLENIAARTITLGMTPYGACMYHNMHTGKFYTFVTRNPYPYTDPNVNNGEVQQWELFDHAGKIDAREVRSFLVGSDAEGCVADDGFGHVYIAETKVGIWKYGAEPQAGSTRTFVTSAGAETGNPELEGVSLYYTNHNTGYLIVSRQCCSEYHIYRREGTNDFVMRFRIASNPDAGIDGVSGTDGLDVTNVALGAAFPHGVVIAHDATNDTSGGNYTNFKLVPWGSLAQAPSPPLTIDTTWNPRHAGGGTPTPSPTLPPTRLHQHTYIPFVLK